MYHGASGLFFLLRGGKGMSNSDYKRVIKDMLDHIEDNKALKAICEFVQKHFLSK